MSEPTQVPPVAGDGDLLQRFNGRLYELTKPAKLRQNGALSARPNSFGSALGVIRLRL